MENAFKFAKKALIQIKINGNAVHVTNIVCCVMVPVKINVDFVQVGNFIIMESVFILVPN